MSDSSISSGRVTSTKKKRKRTNITPDQLRELEHSFKDDPWPNRASKDDLADNLGKSEQFVSIWFQNKRARVKREEELLRKLNGVNGETKKKAKQDWRMRAEVSKRKQHCDHVIGKKKNPILTGSPAGVGSLKNRTKDLNKSMQSASILDRENTPSSSSIKMKSGVQTSQSTHVISHSPMSMTKIQGRYSDCVNDNIARALMQLGQKHHNLGSTSTSKIIKIDRNLGSETSLSHEQRPPTGIPPPALFRAIINMIAVAEGGIVAPTHPEFEQAVNDALYGIQINGTYRLTYTPEDGLEMKDMEDFLDIMCNQDDDEPLDLRNEVRLADKRNEGRLAEEL